MMSAQIWLEVGAQPERIELWVRGLQTTGNLCSVWLSCREVILMDTHQKAPSARSLLQERCAVWIYRCVQTGF